GTLRQRNPLPSEEWPPRDLPPLSFSLPRTGKEPKVLQNLMAAVALRNGDWLVSDDDEHGIHRFSEKGTYVGAFSPMKASRLAINDFDEVAVIDSDVKGITLLGADGKTTATIPAKREGYEMRNPVDVAFDPLGHLYVLDRSSVYVFRQTKPQQWSLITLFNLKEGRPGAFKDATAFAVDAAGRIYIADDHAQRIQLYR